MSIVRSEQHALITTPAVRADMARTLVHYRRVVRLYATIAQANWSALGPLSKKERLTYFESLVHATKARPEVKYPVMRRVLGQMPSYLRRAAIHAALGVVSSYLSNHNNWLDKTPVYRPVVLKVPGKKRPKQAPLGDNERVLGGRPPRLGFSNVYPSLYGGAMIREGAGFKTVQIKLLGADGQWRFTAPLRLRGRLKRLPHRLELSPSLVLKGERAHLVCPVSIRPPRFMKFKDVGRVCAVDVGINTALTAVVVSSTGTVIARKFLTCGRHDGQRDALHERIAHKQSQAGQASRGFCRTLHRRIAGLSLDAARQLSSELVAFALSHGAQAFVFEALKGWKPKGKSRAQRKRFHRFQHRALFNAVALRAEELGMRMVEVYAGGTSRWAYDGSGKVVRAADNAQLATFASGKQYNADLNAASNIAARGFSALHAIKNPRPAKAPDGGKRMPFVLADLWAHAHKTRAHLTAMGASIDAPTIAIQTEATQVSQTKGLWPEVAAIAA